MLTAPMPFSQRLSPGLLAAVIVLHLGIVSLALFLPQAPAPMTPATPLFVRLIEPTDTPPEPTPAPPKPIPPPPKPAPVPPPIQVAKPVTPRPAPVVEPRRPEPVEAPKPEPVRSEPQPVAAPAPAPVEAPKPAPPLPITQPRFNADYLDNPKPPYPSASRRMGEEGEVQLRVSVDANGNVQQIELHKSSGFARLDQSALDTVKRWRFVPARQGNQPVSSSVIVPIQFSLRS